VWTVFTSFKYFKNPVRYRADESKSTFRFFRTKDFNQRSWMVMVCDTYGNVRRDLSSDPARWKNLA
jgi:hypothetical protein